MTSTARTAVLSVVLALSALAAVASGEGPVGAQVELSEMDAADPAFDGFRSAAVHNPQTNQTLVVWTGDDPVDGDDPDGTGQAVFARLVDAGGNPVGGSARISDLYGFVRRVDAAYNPDSNEFAVVWVGGAGSDEDIYGRLLSASAGEVGGDVQISQTGGTGPGTDGDNQDPAVDYNPAADEYLVVWDDNKGGGGNTGQIRAQRMTTAFTETGADDYEVSDAPEDADTPELIYNSAANEYLVVWEGEVGGDDEIFGQRLGATGDEVDDDFQISEQPGEAQAFEVDVTVNAATGDYLVVWGGERLVDNTTSNDELEAEEEIFGQLLTAPGAAVGGDFRISSQGVDGDVKLDAADPRAAHDSLANRYLVSWTGDVSNVGAGAGDDEREVFARCLGADGTGVADAFRVSAHGPDGDPDWDADDSALAFNPQTGASLVAWDAPKSISAGGNPEVEVFGRRATCAAPSYPPPPPAEQPPAPQPPAAQPPPDPEGPSCQDTVKPKTVMRKRGVRRRAGKITLRGSSSDLGGPCPSGVRVVQVSLAKVSGRTGVNCRFVRSQSKFRLTKRQNCRRPVLFAATGTDRWSFTFGLKLEPGTYRAQARAVDRSRNKETPKKGRNIVLLRVR